MSKNWIIVDLDGTLCDCSHRVHLAQAKQWDEFHAGIPDDETCKEIESILALLSGELRLLLCTGRDERQRSATERWLHTKGLDWHFEGLLMRPDGNRDHDYELKPRMVAEYFGGMEAAREAVLLVLDDRDRVVEAWRDAGFKCWQVQAGSY